MKAYTTQYFVERAKSIYGDKYDYSNTKYINTEIPLIITCPKHGDFTIRAHKFLKGRECKKCKQTKNRTTYHLTTEQFVEKAKEIHVNKYDYTKTNYINQKTKITVTCLKHGDFEVVPNYHITDKVGCKICGKESIKEKTSYTTESFIKKCEQIYNFKYDYSFVEYLGYNKKVSIICPIHGEFKISPIHHINNNSGCQLCGYESTSKKLSQTQEEFVYNAIKKHGEKYNYELVNYNGSTKKVSIVCHKHGIFKQIPSAHLQGVGCPKCVGRNKTVDELIIEFKKIHGNKYNYSLVTHSISKSKIDIICSKHGIFQQIPNSHLSGRCCPACNESKGEKKVVSFLEKNKIHFIRQKKFPNCKNKQILPFDFYLPSFNICVEFDGEQHYRPWNSKDKEKMNINFNDLKNRDQIKTDYCKNNNIGLIRIKFDENIENKLALLF